MRKWECEPTKNGALTPKKTWEITKPLADTASRPGKSTDKPSDSDGQIMFAAFQSETKYIDHIGTGNLHVQKPSNHEENAKICRYSPRELCLVESPPDICC